MVIALDVANWMFARFETSKYLYQETIVYKLKKEFGLNFVYLNQNDNLAIGKDVLKEFRKVSEGKLFGNVVIRRGANSAKTKITKAGKLSSCISNLASQWIGFAAH